MELDTSNIKHEPPGDYTLIIPASVPAIDYDIEDLFRLIDGGGEFDVAPDGNNASMMRERYDSEASSVLETGFKDNSKIAESAYKLRSLKLLPVYKKTSSRFICFNCRKSFSSKFKLTKHSECHNTDKLKVPYNPESDKSADEKEFKCDKCPWRFRTKNLINSHLTRVHSDTRPFHCDFPSCSKCFKSLSEANDHRRSVHVTVRPHKCQKCIKSFKLVHQLREHQLRVHEKPKKRKLGCTICSKKFFTKLDLHVHEKRSHLK